jgi:hypothetical protein
MEKCSKCGADTILFEDGVPICVRCSDERHKKDDSPQKDQRIRAVLLQELLETSHLVQSASVGNAQLCVRLIFDRYRFTTTRSSDRQLIFRRSNHI